MDAEELQRCLTQSGFTGSYSRKFPILDLLDTFNFSSGLIHQSNACWDMRGACCTVESGPLSLTEGYVRNPTFTVMYEQSESTRVQSPGEGQKARRTTAGTPDYTCTDWLTDVFAYSSNMTHLLGHHGVRMGSGWGQCEVRVGSV